MADVWVEAKDPKTGKSYYFNKATKKTQWTKPESMLAAEGGDKTDKDGDTEVTEESPADWKEGTDPKSGKTYYYNRKTKATTWKRPACLGSADKPAAAAAASPAAAAATPAAASTPAADGAVNMADWKEAQDPRTGKTYWYNKVTKKTTWNNPALGGEPEKEAPAPAPAPAPAAAATNDEPKKKALSESSDEEDGKGGDDDDDEDYDDDSPEANQFRMQQAMRGGEDGGVDDGDEGDEHEFRFAKHRKGWFNRMFRVGEVFDESALLTFKKSLIKKALLKQNRELDEEAVQAFKNVMSYMGDRKSSKPPLDHAKKLLQNLMGLAGSLRDEVYMQLCKQTTQNPRIVSTIKGWELMVFCIATFPPSKHLKGFLLDFIKRAIKEHPQEKIIGLAQECQKQLPKIVLMGQRKQVPSKTEMQCLIQMQPVPIRVLLCDPTKYKLFMVDSYTLIKEVEEMLVQKYNLTCSAPFAMFEQAEINQERILDPKDRVLDVMASWENRPTQAELNKQAAQAAAKTGRAGTKFDKHKDADKKVVQQVIEYKDYLYKAKLVLKTSNKEIIADPEAVNLIYIQAVSDVVTNRYPSNEKDITVLAALQLQATFGDFKRDTHVPGWLAPQILEYIPQHLVCKKGTQLQDNLVKEWETKILAKYQKVAEFTALDAKLNYLDYVQEWTFYGASFFTVEQRQFKEYPSPLTLGINCEGVLLMHPEKKTVLENYQFTDIVTWGHSDEKFIVVVGNIVQQRKLIFKTSEGKHMNHLIHDYVKFKVKNKT